MLVDSQAKYGLKITILCSDALTPDQRHTQATLCTAAALGVPRYRLGFYKCNLQRPILKQLDEICPAANDLAASYVST